jgi:hypothetical protein
MKKPLNPVEVLRELLGRVQARRALEQDPETQESIDQVHAAGGEMMPDYKGKSVYISFDGDNIGNAVARAENMDDEQTLAQVSQKIQAGQDLFVNFLTQHQGRLIQAGGDEGLGICNSNCLVDLEEFRQQYKELVGATVTVGVGTKISEATKARMLGKLRGKDQVCHFDGSTEKEIELRSQTEDPEAKKLGQAGLIGGVPKFGIDQDQSQDQDWQQDYDAPEQEESSGISDHASRFGEAEDPGVEDEYDMPSGQEPEAEQQAPDSQDEFEDPWDQAKHEREGSKPQSKERRIVDKETGREFVLHGLDHGESEEDFQPEMQQPEEEEQEPQQAQESEEPQQEEQELSDEEKGYGDYTDLPFEERDDLQNRLIAEKIAKEEGVNPNFLYLASKKLSRD